MKIQSPAVEIIDAEQRVRRAIALIDEVFPTVHEVAGRNALLDVRLTLAPISHSAGTNRS